MVTPRTVHTTIAVKIPTIGAIPRVLTMVKMAKPPTMIISPWAKFSILAMPYTMVYPRAMMA